MSACVILESPYAGNVEKHLRYARCAMADCLHKGEAPLASHLLYTQQYVLDDAVEEERAIGIAAGYQWGVHCDYVVVYTDLGKTGGMEAAIAIYREMGKDIFYRTLPNWRNQ